MKNKFKGDREEEKRREEDKRKCDLPLLALQYFQAFRFLCWKERERERDLGDGIREHEEGIRA